MYRNSILLCHKYLFSVLILYLYIARIGVESRKTSCSVNEFHFELTECDATGGRWRVVIPNSSYGSNSGSCDVNLQDPRYAPTRINTCQLSCNAGNYFSVSNLTCSLCDPGTFSLGGGVLYDTWDTIPEAFHTQVESFQSSFSNLGRFSGDVNCSLYGWQPRGEYLASLGGPCAATLTYTVHLVKPGNLSYIYQYSNKDVIFDFEAQNEQCQSLDDSKEYRWPSSTRDGDWKKQVIQLKTGQNVLQWKTIGMESSPGKPIIIKSIEISGVAFTSSCTPCRNGTYSEGGSRSCNECPENHYSGRGARRCIPCDLKSEVAPRGSARCVRRHACTQHDYYETRAPCDANNQTRKEYKWLEPKICRNDLPTAVQLPPPSAKHECSPCNPGMSYRNGSSCEFCPPNFYSDGSGACHKCAPNTTPNYGYQFERWTELPKMISTGCKEPDDYSSVTTGESSHVGCRGAAGWQLGGTHIHTGHQHAPGAYLLLSLDVPGFRSKGGVLGGRRLEAGRISFTFELDCKSKCEFVFMQERLSDALQNDVARIYAINVSNTIDGGAAICLPCHQDTEDRGCIPCPPGHFIDPNTTECTPCPPDTSVSNPLAYGEESLPLDRVLKGAPQLSRCIAILRNVAMEQYGFPPNALTEHVMDAISTFYGRL
ncbi:hypothetical protein B566_EDAN017484 [Ephemera danica]|nr:hypothetical protein B566_EDAN017484 [Ephemera danica]